MPQEARKVFSTMIALDASTETFGIKLGLVP